MKQVSIVQVENGYIVNVNNALSIHPNFGHALKKIREVFDEQKGTASGDQNEGLTGAGSSVSR